MREFRDRHEPSYGWRESALEHDAGLFAVNAIPHEYHPDAHCPLWEETIAQILPRETADDRRIEVLQEDAGFSIARLMPDWIDQPAIRNTILPLDQYLSLAVSMYPGFVRLLLQETATRNLALLHGVMDTPEFSAGCPSPETRNRPSFKRIVLDAP